MSYYTEHAKEFIENTRYCDMSYQYRLFEDRLKPGDSVLDLGSGSGRDCVYFMNKDYEVSALDPTPEFCKRAIELGVKDVYNIYAQDMAFPNKFDGIWACASLLHIPSPELKDVFIKCNKALKTGGSMYASFKYGEAEGDRNGRFYNDMTMPKLNAVLEGTGLKAVVSQLSTDVREGYDTIWLNVILLKI